MAIKKQKAPRWDRDSHCIDVAGVGQIVTEFWSICGSQQPFNMCFPKADGVAHWKAAGVHFIAFCALGAIDTGDTKARDHSVYSEFAGRRFWWSFPTPIPKFATTAMELLVHCEALLADDRDAAADVTAGYLLATLKADMLEWESILAESYKKTGDDVSRRNQNKKWNPSRPELLKRLKQFANRHHREGKTKLINRVADSFKKCRKTLVDRMKSLEISDVDWMEKN